MTAHSRPAADRAVAALRGVFRDRLRSVVAYGPQIDDGGRVLSDPPGSLSCLALVTSLTVADLEACAARTHAWQREGIATPLLLPEDEFRRSLDAFANLDEAPLGTIERVVQSTQLAGNGFVGDDSMTHLRNLPSKEMHRADSDARRCGNPDELTIH